MAAATPESRFLEAARDNDLDGARLGVEAGLAWGAKTPKMKESDWFSSSVMAECERTALMLASARGHVECMRILLPSSNALAVDAHGQNALHIAAKCGQAEAVELLATPEAAQAKDSRGITALMRAAQSGSVKTVEALLGISDQHVVDEEGRDALMWAARRRAPPGSEALATVRLLAEGGNLRARDSVGMSAASIAREAGNTRTASFLESFEAEAERKSFEADQSIAGGLASRSKHL